jgi:hypothetical protein
VNRRTYVVLGGLALLGALAAARLIKSATPIVSEVVDEGEIARARLDAESLANLDNEGLQRTRDERLLSGPTPAPDPAEGVAASAPGAAQASRTRLVLSLVVILALIALIVLLFLKEFLG